jgi:hypothetical protein
MDQPTVPPAVIGATLGDEVPEREPRPAGLPGAGAVANGGV